MTRQGTASDNDTFDKRLFGLVDIECDLCYEEIETTYEAYTDALLPTYHNAEHNEENAQIICKSCHDDYVARGEVEPENWVNAGKTTDAQSEALNALFRKES